jgi:hypothetical protein
MIAVTIARSCHGVLLGEIWLRSAISCLSLGKDPEATGQHRSADLRQQLAHPLVWKWGVGELLPSKSMDEPLVFCMLPNDTVNVAAARSR